MAVSRTFAVRIRGELACFTAPEFSVERVSYPVLTPSAARGILEAILWKPAILWVIEEIMVLADIRFIQFRRNEVTEVVSVDNVKERMKSSAPLDFYADENRAQRNTVALRDVDYAVRAHMVLTDKRGPEDSIAKFESMFSRRLEKGQHATPPVLGVREFPAICEPYTGDPAPLPVNRDFGFVLHDILFGKHKNEARFFHAEMSQGCIPVPPLQ